MPYAQKNPIAYKESPADSTKMNEEFEQVYDILNLYEGDLASLNSLKAPLASPAFTGTPTAPTAAAGTNTTQIATTAFVNTEIATDRPYSSANPSMDGSVSQGTSARVSREDHVHPTDTSRAPLASPGLTGTPTAPTAAVGTNTTQIATTAFVNSEITNERPYATATPLMDGAASVGSSARVARENHVHPSDTAKLSLSGGTMTGILYPQNNTSYTTGQARRIILSTGNPSGGGNGDVWIKYA